MIDDVLVRARALAEEAVRVKRYARGAARPHVAALVAATWVARFPIGINALALILYLREQTGSYAVAGVVAGGLAAGRGGRRARSGPAGRPLGARNVLVPLALRPRGRARRHRRAGPSWARHRRAADLLGRGGLRDPADLGGAALDVAGAAARARRELIPAAYALDSVMIELIFVAGPLLTAVIGDADVARPPH